MQLILPKQFIEDGSASYPTFFLAGPIKGGGDWQHAACLELLEEVQDADFQVVVPCRWKPEHPLYQHRCDGLDETRFSRQTTWERQCLEIAAKSVFGGCVIFWLPCESPNSPRTDGHPYARDSYGELGEWRGRMMHEPDLRVVVGAEKDFPGLDVIHHNFERALNREFPIYETLEETIARAVELSARDE